MDVLNTEGRLYDLYERGANLNRTRVIAVLVQIFLAFSGTPEAHYRIL
jgi:hypothetical protein